MAAKTHHTKPRSEAQKANDRRLGEEARARAHHATAHHKHRRQSPSTIHGDGLGGATAGRGLQTRIDAHVLFEYNEAEIGAIWQGVLTTLLAPSGVVDYSEMFPSPDEKAHDAFARLAPERELGRELGKKLGKALSYFRVDSGRWAAMYGAAMRGMTMASAQGGAISPLGQPSEVVPGGEFGAPRSDGPHQGVDLRAARGTPVVAPTRLKVYEVGQDNESGVYVSAVAPRALDGQFPGILGGTPGTPGVDDSAFIHQFLHLDSAMVKAGDVVEQGQQIGASGATGNVTGPHLDWRVQWFDDGNVFNARTYVDPLGFLGTDPASALASPGTSFGMPDQAVDKAIFIPLQGGVPGFGAAAESGTVVIANNSIVSVSRGGNAVSAGLAGNSPRFDLGGLLPPGLVP